jgi:hypothetical protein
MVAIGYNVLQIGVVASQMFNLNTKLNNMENDNLKTESNNANVLLGAVNNLKLVGSNKGFNVYFNANDQTYTVFKDGKFVIGNKYRFTDVKCYLD